MNAHRDTKSQLHRVANAVFHRVANTAHGFHRFLNPTSALPSAETLSRCGGGTSTTNASSSNRRTGEYEENQSKEIVRVNWDAYKEERVRQV